MASDPSFPWLGLRIPRYAPRMIVTPMLTSTAFAALDLAGLAVFAASGALAAAARRQTLVTFAFFAAVTGTGGGTLRDLLIGAPVERVWQSLTDSAQASAWFGYPIGIEPWVGGRYAMGGFETGYAAKVVDLEPGHRMSIDWGPTGISTWELAESDGKTKLTFVQSGFDEGNPPYAAWSGSVAGLSELRRYHEMADWQPIWVMAELPTGA